MSYEFKGADALGVDLCTYSGSKLMFRGPPCNQVEGAIAFLGGGEVFGRFVSEPFVELLDRELSVPCCNLGVVNAGIDSFLLDPITMRRVQTARVCVLQTFGAHSLNNQFFRVHPRRNDRFLEAMPGLISLFPEFDYTEFHFSRHLLSRLQNRSAQRFVRIRSELQRVWLLRMKLVLKMLARCDVVLLHIDHEGRGDRNGLGPDPLLVVPEMVEALRSLVSSIVYVSVDRAEETSELSEMLVSPLQEPAAGQNIGPSAHRKIAARLLPVLSNMTE